MEKRKSDIRVSVGFSECRGYGLALFVINCVTYPWGLSLPVRTDVAAVVSPGFVQLAVSDLYKRTHHQADLQNSATDCPIEQALIG